MSANAFTHDVFLSHSAKDKAVVREMTKWLQLDRVQVPETACGVAEAN